MNGVAEESVIQAKERRREQIYYDLECVVKDWVSERHKDAVVAMPNWTTPALLFLRRYLEHKGIHTCIPFLFGNGREECEPYDKRCKFERCPYFHPEFMDEKEDIPANWTSMETLLYTLGVEPKQIKVIGSLNDLSYVGEMVRDFYFTYRKDENGV